MRSVSVFLLTVAACAPEPTQGTELPAPAQSVHAAPTTPEAAVATPVDPPVGAPQAEENDPRWHATLRAIAAGYAQWGRVEDEMRWAPWLCRMPMPATARLSDSGDDATHGRKLYTLYARDPVAYGARKSAMPEPDAPALAGLTQVVVKEAWKPVESTVPVQGMMSGERRENLLPAQKDGKVWVAGEKAGLYVLFKPEKTELETDAGWVYGTVAPDGAVTSAGKVGSCMGCHQSATHERLFGLAKDTRAAAVPERPAG
jgi:hypothetical protein